MESGKNILAAVGTYYFGLRGCWGRRKTTTDSTPTIICKRYAKRHKKDQQTSEPFVSIILFPRNSIAIRRPYYIFKIPAMGNSQHRTVAISYKSAKRLYYRFMVANDLAKKDNSSSLMRATNSANDVILSEKESEDVSQDIKHNPFFDHKAEIPGADNEAFIKALYLNIKGKYNTANLKCSWTVSPDLYSVWSCTSSSSVELFANVINESGVLKHYCSKYVEDKIFGSAGSWLNIEDTVEGAGGNPPFNTVFIKEMLAAFEKGVRKEAPYRRCVILPLGSKYGVIDYIKMISSEGILLVSVAEGTLPFRGERHMMSLETTRAKAFGYHKLGLFIWQNRQYLLKYPTPKDVECVYMRWTARALLDPMTASIDFDAFKRAFPTDLRSERCVSALLEV